jgi:hypothetical protein
LCRHTIDSIEQLIVSRRNRIPHPYLITEYPQFHEQYGSLNSIQPTIQTDTHMVIAAILTVPGNLPDNLRQVIVIRKHGAAVPVTTQWLAREETGAGDLTQIA